MKIIIFLGPPCAGKGTQAKLLSDALQFPLIGIGDLLRSETHQQTETGQKIQSFIDNGELVPWDIVDPLFQSCLKEIQAPFVILDGIPRNQTQVKGIEKILTEQKASVFQVIFLDVPQDILIKRMKERYQCANCGITMQRTLSQEACHSCGSAHFHRRRDDREDVIKRRLEVYSRTIDSLLAYYKMSHLVMLIDGTQSIGDIRKTILGKMNHLFQQPSLSFPC